MLCSQNDYIFYLMSHSCPKIWIIWSFTKCNKIILYVDSNPWLGREKTCWLVSKLNLTDRQTWPIFDAFIYSGSKGGRLTDYILFDVHKAEISKIKIKRETAFILTACRFCLQHWDSKRNNKCKSDMCKKICPFTENIFFSLSVQDEVTLWLSI